MATVRLPQLHIPFKTWSKDAGAEAAQRPPGQGAAINSHSWKDEVNWLELERWVGSLIIDGAFDWNASVINGQATLAAPDSSSALIGQDRHHGGLGDVDFVDASPGFIIVLPRDGIFSVSAEIDFSTSTAAPTEASVTVLFGGSVVAVQKVTAFGEPSPGSFTGFFTTNCDGNIGRLGDQVELVVAVLGATDDCFFTLNRLSATYEAEIGTVYK